jgi:hypothetical protein
VSGDPRTAVPIHLTGVQFADMRGRANREKNFDRLVKTLSDELDHPVPEFDLQPGQSGMPVITNIIHVSGHVEGNVYALNVAGDVNVADILPQPFEWCEIPAGQVTLEDNAGWKLPEGCLTLWRS